MGFTASWIVEQGTAFIAWLISGVPDAIPIIGAGVLLYKYRQNVRSHRLRHALLAEIQQAPVELVSMLPEGNQYLESMVYDSNAQKVGLLTDDEIEAVINYYSNLSVIRQIVERKAPRLTRTISQIGNMGTSGKTEIKPLMN